MGVVRFQNRRTALLALSSVPVLGFVFGLILAIGLPGSSHPDDGSGAFGAAGPATATTTLTPTASAGPPTAPSASRTPTSNGTVPRTTRPRTTPARDRIAPTIGPAVTQYAGIWTDFWCSAGPTTSDIQVPVQDRTDPAGTLTVNLRFVLHRSDGGKFDLDTVTVQSDSSPFAFRLGPYPGPNDAYTYDNVIDLVVTATDRAGNKTTRSFASFMTFNDCKPQT